MKRNSLLRKLRYKNIGFALLFGILMCFGYAYSKENTVHLWFGSIKAVVLLPVFSLLAAGLFFITANALFFLWDRLSLSKRSEDRFWGKHTFFKCFLFICVCWMPYLLISYPGGTCVDSSYQIQQIFGEQPFSTQQPLLSTLLIGGFVLAGRALGSYNIGLFLFCLFQMTVCAGIFSYSLLILHRRKTACAAKYFLLAVYAFVPTYGNYVSMVIKDTLFSAFCLLYLTILCQMVEEYRMGHVTWKRALAYVVTAVLTTLLRNNGIYVVLLTTIFILGSYFADRGKRKEKRLFFGILVLLLPVVLYFGMNTGLIAATNAEKETTRGLLGIPFQQTARYLRDYGDEVTEGERAAIQGVINEYDILGDIYDPDIADPIVYKYKLDSTKEDLGQYFKAWAAMLLKHPLCYVEAAANQMYGWFYLGADNDIRYVGRLPVFSEPRLGDWKVKKIIEAMGDIPFFWILENIAVYVWTMFLFHIYAGKRKIKDCRYALAFLDISLLICMMAPACFLHPRYAFPITFSLPFVILFYVMTPQQESCSA